MPALYAGIGAIIGGLLTGVASFAATLVQQRAQDRRDLVRMAVDLGTAEYEQDIALARDRAGLGRSDVAPLASYVIIAKRTLDILSKKGDVTPEDVRRMQTEKLLAAFPGYPGETEGRDGEH
ncbi:hypothetical protein HOR67_gp01 [Ralstonia phage RS-PI-1]|uniref:Uncharacterized protein n=1 Tax=Ralstonia phage RS-PI-1 TaxID=1958965 RepID=A0A1S6L1C2_9CAUD|nr:hypothetical protein HOR67_gp01 [Ralstonia phage RS-PI-1]AQT27763.1 hypothetical protein [Ralstonia phage RS-PI-1]